MTATAKQNEWAKVGEDVRAVNTSSDFTPLLLTPNGTKSPSPIKSRKT